MLFCASRAKFVVCGNVMRRRGCINIISGEKETKNFGDE